MTLARMVCPLLEIFYPKEPLALAQGRLATIEAADTLSWA